MDRQKRSNEENPLWRDPCGYNNGNSKGLPKHVAAKRIASQAKYVIQQASDYKESIASLHDYEFDKLLEEWKGQKLEWIVDEVVPEDKMLFTPPTKEQVHETVSTIHTSLPKMYKTLKMTVAALHMLSEGFKNDGIKNDEILAGKLSQTMENVRAVLCSFYDLMVYNNLEIQPVYDVEVQEMFNKKNIMVLGVLIYRDTLNYLEFLVHVMSQVAVDDNPALM